MVSEKRVSMLGFFNDKGEILLSHRDRNPEADDTVWEIIGGGVEPGETPEQAIIRETREELNYDLRDEDKLTLSGEFKMEDPPTEVYFFKANLPGIENFSDTNEVLVGNLKLFPIAIALNLQLLPICREILQRITP